VIRAESGQETLASRAANLFRSYRDGDDACMGELVALLTPILWHTVRAQRLDRESAEDVVQSAWLALVRGAESIADPQAVLQWLIVTAKRESWRVSKRADRVVPKDFADDEVVTPSHDLTEERVLRTDDQNRLWRHIAELPQRCQALLRVIAFADRPDYAAVAKSLGMPVGSIGPTRGRCLAKLRLQLANDAVWENS
jgi:RNA polymerase sigma factor (sigma-70 family)